MIRRPFLCLQESYLAVSKAHQWSLSIHFDRSRILQMRPSFFEILNHGCPFLYVLGEEGAWCFAAGLLVGLEIGLLALGLVPGQAGTVIILEMALVALSAHIDFPTATQCKVYGSG